MVERRFDPAVLRSLAAAGIDDEAVIHSRTARERVLGTLSALAIGARVVGMAAATAHGTTDEGVLRSIELVLKRMSALRIAALDVAGVDRSAPEFAEAFNLATGVALEAVTQEWWASHVAGDKPRFLSPEAFRKVFEMLAEHLGFEARKDEHVKIDLERKFGVLAALPKVWAAVNYFDYFVADRDLLMARLVRAVSAQAEIASARFCNRYETEGTNVLRRMLSLSSSLMVEVYKECAARDVEELRSLSVADRSVRLCMTEGVGLAYDHVLDAHEAAVQRAMDLADLVSEVQPASA